MEVKYDLIGNYENINNNIPENSGNALQHVSIPVRRVLRRALAKARLREIGIAPTDEAAAILTRIQGGRRNG